MTENLFNGMFGKIGAGMCRLSMSGGIAVKTSNGYKSYDPDKNRLTNCSSFVFDIGEEFFFVIPTNKVEKGDIILQDKKPKCVISASKDSIKVLDYETAVVEDILPERHVFMGETYFYGKIVSMFGKNPLKGKKGMDKMMSYMMMSQMMRGSDGKSDFSAMLPFMMMNGGGSNMFSGMFEGLFDEEEDKIDG